ncbi:MAG: acyl-CoA dehydrogenase family protein [Xanthomonadaceae bacterium]|nr:acyl-CoA dehydrogenase family protein [Xanthomonadaceae bacterium]MDE2224259.1 acyl-CoA dehydrogenase family protein [Xanthomonadaceae bacterium]
MNFVQPAPQLADPYRDDRVLQAWLARVLPEARRRAAESDFIALANYARRAYARQTTSTPSEPALTRWDVWGHRVDRIELTETWREGPAIASKYGLVADGHDRSLGEFARVQQFAKVYLYHAASAFYSCPLAMTDGVATALRSASNTALRERVLPHLLSRDPATFRISGQWMTENAGGSDVGGSETTARRGADGTWRLNGRKWFTSAINAEVALALARPEGNPAGTDGLALFCVETRNADGAWNGITLDRLKDKLGTRELPTAEIHLHDTRAELVGDTAHGVRAIAPVLQVTRLWNAFGSLSTMARCLALTRDYAHGRMAFGKPLVEQPLFADSLAGWEAEFEAAFHLAMEVALLLGRVESGTGDERDAALQRLLTPLAKLWICKLGVRIASETVEAFGGIGYLEDSGIPLLLRDAQVFPIWEGASNVQALDFLRALEKNGMEPLVDAVDGWLETADGTVSGHDAEIVHGAIRHADTWLRDHARDVGDLQAGALRLGMTCARGVAAALLARHAAWARLHQNDSASANALRRFCAHGLDSIIEAV